MNENSKRKSLRKKLPLIKENSKKKSLRKKSPLMKKNSKRKSLRKKSNMKRKNDEDYNKKNKEHQTKKNKIEESFSIKESFSIENHYLYYFFNLLHEKEEMCGYLVITDENQKRIFNLKPADEHNKGEEITKKGESVSCNDIILIDKNENIFYPPCRWHTHPIYANPYPSPMDMFHLIAIKELDTSILFTTLGIWEIYYDEENIWNNLTEEEKKKYSRYTMDKMLGINNIFYTLLNHYFYSLPEKYMDTIIKNKNIKEYIMENVNEYINIISSQFKIKLNFSLWGDTINNKYNVKSPISKKSFIEFNEILKNPNIERFKHK